MNHRLLAGLLTLAAACGGGASSSTSSTTPAPAPATAPSADQPCGYDILGSARQQGGACLEPAVLGADKTAQCQAFLEQNGWQRDSAAETMIGHETGKTIVCFRAPGSPTP